MLSQWWVSSKIKKAEKLWLKCLELWKLAATANKTTVLMLQMLPLIIQF
jgi:hypothetical protein